MPADEDRGGGGSTGGSATFTHETIAAEHRRVDDFLADVGAAFDGGAGGVAPGMALSQLADEMEAHFGREESLYYPTLWVLRPDLKGSLTRLIDVHGDFRARLKGAREALDASRVQDARHQIAEFADLFAEHEAAEQQILDSIAFPAG